MAQISFSGLDDFMLSMEQIAAIPEDVKEDILNAQADIVAAAQQQKARAYNVVDTGLVAFKIGKTKIKKNKGEPVIYVYPQGSRRRTTKKTGKSYTVRNAEIAFVNEYGTRKQKARPFIRDANESTAAATTQACMEIYDRWLKSLGL